MKILFLTHTSSMFGANRSLIDVINIYKSKKHSVRVIIPVKGPVEELLNLNNIPYTIIKIYPLVYLEKDTTIFYWLKYIVKLFISFIGFLRLLSFVKAHKYNLIYSNSIIVWMGIYLSKLLDIKHILHVRELFYNYSYKYPFHNYFVKMLFNQSSQSIFISKTLQDNYKKYHNSEKVFVIYDGIYYKSEMNRSPKLDFTKDPFTICMVGQLLESKGQVIALKAVKLLLNVTSSVKLIIVGLGNKKYEQKLKYIAKQLEIINNVQFVGVVSDCSLYYKQAACSLVCTTFEAFGRVVIESFYYGTPVIGRNSGALPELIKHQYNGFLFDGTPESLATQLMAVYNQEIAYKELSMHAKETVFNRFNKDRFDNQLITLMDSCK